ncbi:uncharacterized protein LOC125075648 [Vanessa atalanta]|uniref:uncharacterized protein LOC125075648 n=1 Tax=Vanessa atalanta TaxID=42275 RepID=UPI001FCD1C14|nr:uncharacterized protein LOC125075648 [Vanessa atalanta]
MTNLQRKVSGDVVSPVRSEYGPEGFCIPFNWVAQSLREQGIRIIVYLDDFLVVHQNPQILQSHVQITVERLQYLGWMVNFDKSTLAPCQRLVYLGVQCDTLLNEKSLPEKKCLNLVSKISTALKEKTIDLKALQSLVGLLNFASFVVPRGRLHFRALLSFLNTVSKIPVAKFKIPVHALKEFTWWLQNHSCPSLIHFAAPMHFLATDASDVAWGAQLDNRSFPGSWNDREQLYHCNQKELLALLKILQKQGQFLSCSTVLWQCDNRTAVAFIRKEGGTKSIALLELTIDIFEVLDRYQIHLAAYHIPGKFNSHADHLSRYRSSPEWHLLPTCTDLIFNRFGVPVIDLFASEDAHVVANYVFLDQNDNQALFHDAFSQTWNYHQAWIFPPPYLIPKVLAHLNLAKGLYLLVVPRWERVFWRADIKSRALAAPFTIKHLNRHLIDISTGLPPPKVKEMTLEVWKCLTV